jgi:hypothetical protein
VTVAFDSPRIGRLLRIAGLAGGIALAVVVWATFMRFGGDPGDATTYWTVDPEAPYWRPEYQFLYAPAFAQALIPFQALPFDVWVGLIRGLEAAALVLLAGPATPLVLFTPPVITEINAGNVNLLAIAAVVYGFRWPALWAFVLLSKVTFGIGLLWFVVRREWRSLAIALGVTAAISLVSFIYRPGLWFDWVAFIASLAGGDGTAGFLPVWFRLPVAALLVIWGARTDRPWAMGVAMFVAIPRLYPLSPVVLVGVLPLRWPSLALVPPRIRRRSAT